MKVWDIFIKFQLAFRQAEGNKPVGRFLHPQTMMKQFFQFGALHAMTSFFTENSFVFAHNIHCICIIG